MPTLIKLLLSKEKDVEKKMRAINQAAVAIYDSAYETARKKAQDKKRAGLEVFGADAISPELACCLTKLVASENLVDEQHYYLILLALNQWTIKSSFDWDDGEEKFQFKLHRVKQMLEEYVLPTQREEQQQRVLQRAFRQKMSLEGVCVQYADYLQQTLLKEQNKLEPNQTYIELTQAKMGVIQKLRASFEDGSKSVEEQLYDFKMILEQNRAVLAILRDKTEQSIFMSIVNVLFIKPTHSLGLWKIQGEAVAARMDGILNEQPLLFRPLRV